MAPTGLTQWGGATAGAVLVASRRVRGEVPGHRPGGAGGPDAGPAVGQATARGRAPQRPLALAMISSATFLGTSA